MTTVVNNANAREVTPCTQMRMRNVNQGKCTCSTHNYKCNVMQIYTQVHTSFFSFLYYNRYYARLYYDYIVSYFVGIKNDYVEDTKQPQLMRDNVMLCHVQVVPMVATLEGFHSIVKRPHYLSVISFPTINIIASYDITPWNVKPTIQPNVYV